MQIPTSSSPSTALGEAIRSTFELLAFMVAEPECTPEQEGRPLAAGVQVRFRGQISGVLEVEAFGPILPELAANMLALAEAPSREQELSAFAEVANVVCGNVLPAVCGAQAVFDLSEPEVSHEPVIRRPAGDGLLARARLGMGEGYVEATLRKYA